MAQVIEYVDVPVDVHREELIEVVREVEVPVEVVRYVDVEIVKEVEREKIEEEVVEVEQVVTVVKERVTTVTSDEVEVVVREEERVTIVHQEELIEEIEEVYVNREFIVEREVETVVPREVIKEIVEEVDVVEWIEVPTPREVIEYIDVPIPRHVTKEVIVEVHIPGRTVINRIEEPFEVVREVVVQKVRELEVVVETTDDLPPGWGIVMDEAAEGGVYYYNRDTDERSDKRPGGERPCGCATTLHAPPDLAAMALGASKAALDSAGLG